MGFFEDMEVGQRRELGSFTFTAELIKKFASKFDPQRFHLDEEEGRNSLFGGLAASGWHVAAVCMKMMVAEGQHQAKEAAARGEKVAVWGPSPGFRELPGSGPCWPGTPSASAARSNRSARRPAVQSGASCSPATRAPINAANWCTRFSQPASCHGGTPGLEARDVPDGTISTLTHFQCSSCQVHAHDRQDATGVAAGSGALL